jgi:hypothetical protein
MSAAASAVTALPAARPRVRVIFAGGDRRDAPREPGPRATVDRHLGAGLLAAGLSAIVLVTNLGGTTWAWGRRR